ncbi:hypothetical protein AB5J52_02170 [Streptomyces sp. R39]|uniref:Uncharacterized protein n=1 Tax=Streptomyces sp. R39 TaxID=3238631 RepID=A0AB39QFY0_9ACTN
MPGHLRELRVGGGGQLAKVRRRARIRAGSAAARRTPAARRPIPRHAVAPGRRAARGSRPVLVEEPVHNVLVRGEPRAPGAGRVLVPAKAGEPMGPDRVSEAVSVLRGTRRAAGRRLGRRGLPRPRVRWEGFRASAQDARRR